jgi:threonine dehydratase
VLTFSQLESSMRIVYEQMRPTPSYRWPLLEEHTGTETWVKHENQTPTGAFKVRGGLVYVAALARHARAGEISGIVAATRGNHGQSLAFAARAHGLQAVIVVPHGNSPAKNASMRAWGAELVEHGTDFQEAREHAAALAESRGLQKVDSYHALLMAGVATYAAELHEQVPELDVVYVPVGMGSGICANIAVRDLLRKDTEVVGVVAERADATARSFEAGEVVTTPTADTFVDGVATRSPDPEAIGIIVGGAARVLRVGEAEAEEAMRVLWRTTRQMPEPSGSLALAGLLAERDRVRGRRVAVVMTGGNCDDALVQRVLATS